MARNHLILAASLIAAASPLSAQPDSGPIEPSSLHPPAATPAPAGGPTTKYCMRVTMTGSAVEPVRCWTRDQWVEQGVDVDRDWASEGVKVVEG